jgi:hypothetical protein
MSLAKVGRTSFSEEKEAKRLSLLRALAVLLPKPAGAKVFWLLFFKKVTSSSIAYENPACRLPPA